MFFLLPLWGEYPDGERQAEDWVEDQQSRRPGGMEESSEQAGHINAAVYAAGSWKAGGGSKSLEPISYLLFLNFNYTSMFL